MALYDDLYGTPAPAPAAAPAQRRVAPVVMPQPVASAPAPDPLVAAMQSMKAGGVAPAAIAGASLPRQQGESPRAYDQRMAIARAEADKAAREAVAPKVGADPAAFSAKEQKLKDFEGYLKDYKDELAKNLTVFPTKIPLVPSQGIEIPLPVGSDTARMQAKYNALLMGVKDAYQLGALTGPDMGIVEAQITNPASISGMMHSKEAFGEQVKVLDDILNRAKTNLETSYGRKMSYTVPAKPAAQGAQETAPPPSLLKEGHVTTFANGQQWSMRNGKAERVK